MLMGVKQPTNFGDEGGLDCTGVDIMPKVLYAGLEASVEFFRRGVISNQDTDIHPFHDFLGAKTLKVFANGSVGLAEFVWFIQHFFLESKEGFVWKEDC